MRLEARLGGGAVRHSQRRRVHDGGERAAASTGTFRGAGADGLAVGTFVAAASSVSSLSLAPVHTQRAGEQAPQVR